MFLNVPHTQREKTQTGSHGRDCLKIVIRILNCSSELMTSDQAMEKDSVIFKEGSVGVQLCSNKHINRANYTCCLIFVGEVDTRVGGQTWEEQEMSLIGLHCMKFPDNLYKYFVRKKKVIYGFIFYCINYLLYTICINSYLLYSNQNCTSVIYLNIIVQL